MVRNCWHRAVIPKPFLLSNLRLQATVLIGRRFNSVWYPSWKRSMELVVATIGSVAAVAAAVLAGWLLLAQRARWKSDDAKTRPLIKIHIDAKLSSDGWHPAMIRFLYNLDFGMTVKCIRAINPPDLQFAKRNASDSERRGPVLAPAHKYIELDVSSPGRGVNAASYWTSSFF